MTEPNTFADENIHDMNTNQLTAIKIKDERIRLNYTQQTVADHLGMDISNYSRLENGKVEITISKLEAIAEFFKVPLVSLLPINIQGSVNINNGNYSFNGNMIHNDYTNTDLLNTLQNTINSIQQSIEKLK